MSQGKSVSVRVDSGEVSFQVYQDIYNSITGRSERLSKFFLDPHVLKMNDVAQLRHAISQTLEQYSHSELSCRVAVSYGDGKTETFSGIDRFVLQAPAAQQAVHDIDIVYSFFLVLPKTQEPKSYKLVVSLRSEIAAIERMDHTKATFAERQMYFNLSRATSKVEIEYVDLAVARNLEATVETWYSALHKRNVTLLKGGRLVAKAVSILLRPLIYVSVTFAFLFFAELQAVDQTNLFFYLMVFICSLFVVAPLSAQIEKFISNWINLVGCHSMILFSDADKRLEEKHTKKVGLALFKSIGSGCGSVLLSLAAAYLAVQAGIN